MAQQGGKRHQRWEPGFGSEISPADGKKGNKKVVEISSVEGRQQCIKSCSEWVGNRDSVDNGAALLPLSKKREKRNLK